MSRKTLLRLFIAALVSIGSLQSCAVFKKDCGCPSAFGGKQR